MPACRWACCTISRWGSTRTVPTRGRWPTCSPPGSASARLRTTSRPRGQDWGLPPWRPDRLAATGYAALRDMLRAVLAHADGLRIDHVAGLWRLWWIPPGDGPDRGTYVHYDADVMLGGAGAGGPPGRGHRRRRGPGHRRAGGHRGAGRQRDARLRGVLVHPRRVRTRRTASRPADWPTRAAASISTHDLPTAAGFLRGEHVRARADLGLLDDVDGRAGQRRRGTGRVAGAAACGGAAVRRCGRRAGRGGDHRRDAPFPGVDPEPAEADLALRRHRRSRDSPTCRAPSTSTRTGGCRCR